MNNYSREDIVKLLGTMTIDELKIVKSVIENEYKIYSNSIEQKSAINGLIELSRDISKSEDGKVKIKSK